MISQRNISASTPMGVTLVDGGATFRTWAPRAVEVYVNGTFGGVAKWDQSQDQLMAKDPSGYWTGFVDGVRDGDPFKFYVVGPGSRGYKRDPYARELAQGDPFFPSSNCLVRDDATYQWHDGAFVTPDFSNMIVYQLHVGTYAPSAPGAASTFLDVIERIEYLAALGINVLQPLPVDEFETMTGLGYNGSDYLSPDLQYVVTDGGALARYKGTVDRLRAAKGVPPIDPAQLVSGPNQIKAMVDLCHLYGIAVVLDVVYNHAGGFQGDDQALFFWDRAQNGNNDNSLYFTSQEMAGGLSFALWNRDVRQFLINTARYYAEQFHADGFRYDEISALVRLNGGNGWSFCQDITSNVRFIKPRALQNAEYWPVDPALVRPASQGGAGFDVTQHDALRISIRNAIAQSAFGASVTVDLTSISKNLYPPSYPHAWQAVTCAENHDLVRAGKESRLPTLADGSNHRSWYARSRSRVATALLLTAPGIPQLFMGQEFLEDKQWSDDPRGAGLIYWGGAFGADKAMSDHLRFTQDAIRLRWSHAALRGDAVNAFHVHDQNRVLAFHRWIEGTGGDVIVVASLNDATHDGYAIGFPGPGRWLEVFNSDVYDGWVNPNAAGNGGAVDASGPPLHGFPASAAIVIPANGVVVFARDGGV